MPKCLPTNKTLTRPGGRPVRTGGRGVGWHDQALQGCSGTQPSTDRGSEAESMDRAGANFSRGRGSAEKPEMKSIVFRDGEGVRKVDYGPPVCRLQGLSRIYFLVWPTAGGRADDQLGPAAGESGGKIGHGDTSARLRSNSSLGRGTTLRPRQEPRMGRTVRRVPAGVRSVS